jgi:5-methyltetrahydrofolate--homocysteine methyltransferase
MNLLDEIAVSIMNGDADEVKKLTEQALSQNVLAEDILKQGLVSGMNVVSKKFKNNELFIPEVLISAKAMKAGMGVIKPLLAQANVQSKGKVVMGTVSGDLHDIGKSIVAMLLEGAGFEVIDLGADVPLEKFMESIKKEDADIVGMSALLTTTMTFMKVLIDELEKTGLKKKVKVMVGGAPVTSAFAEEIKADGYAPDAAQAVDLAISLLN